MTRVGFARPRRVMWQGAEPWGKAPYGRGALSVGRAGCPAVALAEAVRFLRVDPSATPLSVIERALRHKPAVWAPGSSNAILPELARAQRLQCPGILQAWWTAGALDVAVARGQVSRLAARRIRCLNAAEMGEAVCEHIRAGGVVWTQVDHTADGAGDHWGTAFAFDDVDVEMTDSATAKVETLSRLGMAGRARWGRVERAYQAVRAYPLRRAE